METSQIALSFANISGKKIEADFDGGMTTSDGGALLLRQAEARTGIVDRIVAAMSDRRHQAISTIRILTSSGSAYSRSPVATRTPMTVTTCVAIRV